MRIKLLAIMFLFVFGATLPVQAQTRVLFGGGGGQLYGNITASVITSVEIPIKSHLEVDLLDEFSLYENHIALGSGTANLDRSTGILWATKHVGLVGSFENSEYSVTIHKTTFKALGGVVFRREWLGSPTRIELDYVRQIANKLHVGTESNYLQGGRIAIVSRLGCHGVTCYRLGWEMQGGKTFLQGNPQCDGTLGLPITCPRQTAIAGGVKAFFVMEWPRRKRTEDDIF